MNTPDYPTTVPAVLEAARDRIARAGLWGRDDAGNGVVGYSINAAVEDVFGLLDPFGGEVYDRTPRGMEILDLAERAIVALATTAGRPGLRPHRAAVALVELSQALIVKGGRPGERGWAEALSLFNQTIKATTTLSVETGPVAA